MAKEEMVGWHHQFNGPWVAWTQGLVMDWVAWHAAVHGLQRVGHD